MTEPDVEPITAPAAAAHVETMLLQAQAHAAAIEDATTRTSALLAVAEGWRQLAVSLSQHQAMTPRPRDDSQDATRVNGGWRTR
jgi:hypothetical protein